jgi:P-type conjugative transfer protein TrbJ
MRADRTLRKAALVAACTFGVGLLPSRADAQFAVIDASNLAENITQVAKAIQQINNQRLQIQYQLQALKKLGNTNWRDIQTLVLRLDMLMQQGQALAYSLANLDQVFQQTFPGWQVASSNLVLPVSQRIQAERTLATMRTALNVLAEQARQFGNGQATLAAIKAQMGGIAGHQEALELQATLDAFLAEEIGLLRQTLTTQANMQAVYNAYVVNAQAEVRANYRAMVDVMSLLPPPSRKGFSLVMIP